MNEKDFQDTITESMNLEKCARQVLGVSGLASKAEIKRVFWQLAKKYHPDRCPENKEAKRRFQDMVNAYDLLVKGKKRGIKLENVKSQGEEPTDDKITAKRDYFSWWQETFMDDFIGGFKKADQAD